MSEMYRSVSPRLIGPTSYVILLVRVPLLVTIVLVAFLSDLVIAGSMREAFRYAIQDSATVAGVPLQFAAITAALLLACVAIRFTGEAIVELVSPDLFDVPGHVGSLARVLPRACAMIVGLVTAVPLLQLAANPAALASVHERIVAAAFGGIFIAIGIATAIVFRAPIAADGTGADRASPWRLRALLATVPLVIAAGFIGTVLGLWRPDSGMAHGALERYRQAGSVRLIAEAFALFFTCVSARLATGIVIDLIAPRVAGEAPDGRALYRLLTRFAALAVGVALVFELASAQGDGTLGVRAPGPARPWFWGTAGAYIVIAFLASLSGPVRLMRFGGGTVRLGKRWFAAAERMAALSTAWSRFFAGMSIAAIGLFFFFADVSRVAAMQALGPIAIVLFWGFTAAVIFFPIAYLSHMTRMPLLIVILLAAIAFSGFDLNDNHELRSASAAPPVAADRRSASDYREYLDLGEWLASRRDWDKYERYPIFLVATEGGGIRAAYYTATVLAALQERCPAFAQHTLLVSGVSGGSVGASVFAALTADRAANLEQASCNLAGMRSGKLVSQARKVLSTDLLSPLLGATLFPDSLQRVLPVPIPAFDRSRALEYAIEESWHTSTSGCRTCDPDRMGEAVSALYRHTEPRNPVPHLFLNTTEAGTGRSIPFATVQVTSLATPYLPYAQIDDAGPAATRLISLQDRIADDRVPLSTAAMLSARFPYLTPAGRIGDVGHYVDGGYFENSGTWILSGVVQNLIGQRLTYRNAANPELERAVRNAVFVTVVLQSAPCTRDKPFARCAEDGSASDSDTGWSEGLSPLRALLNTRDKRADYSINDLSALTALVEQLTGAPAEAGSASGAGGETGCRDTMCAVTLRFRNGPRVEVPLTWVLSAGARKAMDEAVDRMEKDDVRPPPPPADLPDFDAENRNRILGSYRRIVCILDARNGTPGCAPPPSNR